MSSMIKGVNFKISATNAAGPAIAGFNRGVQSMRDQVQQTGPLMRSWNAGLNSNRRMIQQVGFQMSDFAIQIAGGQSAMLAFTQQGGQILQFFGPFGAMAAAALAIFGSLAIGITKSGVALNQLYPYFGAVENELRGLVAAIQAVGDMMGTVGRFLIENLDTIVIAMAVTAGWFGVKWVAAVITATITTGAFSNVLRATALVYAMSGTAAAAATLATSAFSAALSILRTALIRLGLPAIILAVSYLIERFLTLAKGAGGLGNAMVLLGNLFSAVFDDIGNYMSQFSSEWGAMTQYMVATFTAALASALFAANTFFRGLARHPLLRAFIAAMGSWDFNGPIAELNALSATSQAAHESMMADAAATAGSWTNTRAAWQALKDALARGDAPPVSPFGGPAGGDPTGAGAAADAATAAADQVETTFENMQKSISSSMLAAFKSLADGSKSFAEVAMDLLGSVADKVIDILMTPVFNSLAGSLAGGILGGLTGMGATVPTAMPSFDGGGDTWSGPRVGGVDGKGGRLALLHSDETVEDHRSPSGKGGQVINVTFNISTPDANSFRKSRSQIQAEMAQAVKMGARGN
jgi:hypothetical protein